MVQSARSLKRKIRTIRELLWGMTVAGQEETKRLICLSFVHAPRWVEPVSEVQTTARNEDKRQGIKGYLRRRLPMVCLHVCRGLMTI
jgi:hypothetical protein